MVFYVSSSESAVQDRYPPIANAATLYWNGSTESVMRGHVVDGCTVSDPMHRGNGTLVAGPTHFCRIHDF